MIKQSRVTIHRVSYLECKVSCHVGNRNRGFSSSFIVSRWFYVGGREIELSSTLVFYYSFYESHVEKLIHFSSFFFFLEIV